MRTWGAGGGEFTETHLHRRREEVVGVCMMMIGRPIGFRLVRKLVHSCATLISTS